MLMRDMTIISNDSMASMQSVSRSRAWNKITGDNIIWQITITKILTVTSITIKYPTNSPQPYFQTHTKLWI